MSSRHSATGEMKKLMPGTGYSIDIDISWMQDICMGYSQLDRMTVLDRDIDILCSSKSDSLFLCSDICEYNKVVANILYPRSMVAILPRHINGLLSNTANDETTDLLAHKL